MEEQPAERPNVIWIFGDQHRAQALGCMGDANVHTPNIDRLAAEGVVFTSAVAGSPLCSPARGALLTGCYPHHSVPGHQEQLPPDQLTIAHAFQAAGYHTAYFGKWHLDGFKEEAGKRAAMHIVPPERRGGFDTWIGYENNNSQWDCWVHGGAGEAAFHHRLPTYETDALTELLIDYLRQRSAGPSTESVGRAAQPFFAVLSVQPPHDPYVSPEVWMARHTPPNITLRPNVPAIPRIVDLARRELAGYYAMIENLDWNLGRIRDTLAETGLAHQTHIIFFSDHGDMHGSHGQFRKTAPWEEAIRIPLIIGGHVPHYVHRLGRYPAPVNLVDIAPTTLGLCGIDVPPEMEGTDYAGYRIASRAVVDEPDSAYLQMVLPTRHHHSVDRPWRGIVTRDRWKYVVFEGAPWLLFNLDEDTYEQANMAHNTRYATERRQLHDRLAAWVHNTGDHFSLPQL